MEFDDDGLHDTMADFVGNDIMRAVRMPDSPKTDFANIPIGIAYSPIKEAANWASAPEGAKECTLLLSGGLIHRPCLILKNADGIYDTMQIFKNKKTEEPLATLRYNEYVQDIIDEAYHKDEKATASRNMRILEMAEDGSMLKLWISAGMDIHNDTLWHPKSLLKEVIENVGYPQPVALAGGHDVKLLADCMCRTWEAAAEWQAGAIKYLIKAHDLDVVFSHFHSVDLQGHMLVQYLKKGSKLQIGRAHV